METLGDKNLQKTCIKPASKYFCGKCNYGTSRKSSYDEHNLTLKHLRVMNADDTGQNPAKKLHKNCNDMNHFLCELCDKQYQHRQGLWRHRKACHIKEKVKNEEENAEDTLNNKPLTKDDLILMLMKENKEFKAMLMEQQTVIIKVLENCTITKTTTQTSQ